MTDYPTEICYDCGYKHGKPKVYAVGVWTGKCGWCGAEGAVTSPRDFGYPEPPARIELATSRLQDERSSN